MGALMGFALTFVTGSPIIDDAMGVVVRSVAGGAIFGSLGFVIGSLVSHYINERSEEEAKAYLLKKELKRQEKLNKAQDAAQRAVSRREERSGQVNDSVMVEAAFGREERL